MTDTDRFEARFQARLQARADLAARPFDDLGIARDAMAVARRRRSWWPGPDVMAAVRPIPHPGWLLMALLAALVAGALAVGSQLLGRIRLSPYPQTKVGSRPRDRWAVTRHGGFTATCLRDGRVVVVGGGSDKVEIWDPATGLFSPRGSLALARRGHTATLLDDGRVLIVGGGDGNGETMVLQAEIWDPDTGASTLSGSLFTGRGGHTATLLRDGRVLIVEGSAIEGPIAFAEIWDPNTGMFSAAGSLIGGGTRSPRHPWTTAECWSLAEAGHTCLRPRRSGTPPLRPSTGLGLLTERTQCQAAYPYCPIEAGPMVHNATLLNDGRVLVIGGTDLDINSVARASAEVWGPRTNEFSVAGHMAQGRQGHTATLLPDGRVLVTGGSDAFTSRPHATRPRSGTPPRRPSARPGH